MVLKAMWFTSNREKLSTDRVNTTHALLLATITTSTMNTSSRQFNVDAKDTHTVFFHENAFYGKTFFRLVNYVDVETRFTLARTISTQNLR